MNEAKPSRNAASEEETQIMGFQRMIRQWLGGLNLGLIPVILAVSVIALIFGMYN